MTKRIFYDDFRNIENPTLVLAKRNGDKIGIIPSENISFKDNFNTASEISFSVSGNGNEFWNEIKDFRLIWYKEIDLWFEIKVEVTESDYLIKNVTGETVCESELSQVNVNSLEINTEDDIARDDYTEPTIFYNNENKKSSLLDRVLERVPHYVIKHVDNTLAKIQKTFSFDDKSVLDCFQEIAEEVGCLFKFDSSTDSSNPNKIARSISVYDLYSNCNKCGYRGEFSGKCPECGSEDFTSGYGKNTNIFISVENLAKEIRYNSNADSVKNCFKIVGGDDLMTATVRNCNPNGTDYIWYITEDQKADMSETLVKKINAYDKDYNNCQDKREISLNKNCVIKYNELVEKYKSKNDSLNKVSETIIGFSDLMTVYYDTIDFALYLQTSMMPEIEFTETTAAKEAAKLTTESMSPIAVSSPDSMSLDTATSWVISMAKLIIQGDYKVLAETKALSGKTWTGALRLLSYKDETDTAITTKLTIEFNSNYQDFIEQKLKRVMKDNASDDYDISSLFKLDIDEFKSALKDYSLDCLNSFSSCAQGVLDIFVDAGISNTSNELYDEMYLPYYNKQTAIKNEISVRTDEIGIIVGVYDTQGELSADGLQTYIIEEKNKIQDEMNFENYLGSDLWNEFCSFRREQKYSNQNYVSDGLNNVELFDRARELIKVASAELYKSAELQHSVSGSIHNFLAMKEFATLIENFEVGNYIHIEVDGKIYRLRLLQYEVNFDSPEDIPIEFSDAVKIRDGMTDIQSIFKQASSMATSYDAVVRQASQGAKGNKKINDWVQKGLDLTNTKIVTSAENQSWLLDSHGALMREYFPVTDSYSSKQAKIINKGLYITDDDWKTSRAAIGEFRYIDPSDNYKEKTGYGVIADTIVGKIILSENVGIYNKNGSIKLDKNGFNINNGKFKVDYRGNVEMKGSIVLDGEDTYISAPEIKGGTITIGGTAKTPNFKVDENGNVTTNGNVSLNGKGTKLNAPIINGGIITGGVISGGTIKGAIFTDSNDIGRLTLSSLSGGGGQYLSDMTFSKTSGGNFLFKIYEEIATGVSIALNGTRFGTMTTEDNAFHPNGKWVFGTSCTVEGLGVVPVFE